MAIIDAFQFHDELDLLEIRLNELYSVVDRFVLVEAPYTHSGLPKPLYYHENRDRFREFRDKIVAINAYDMPITPAQVQAAISLQDRVWLDTGYQLGADWVRERFQRNKIMVGLLDCDPDDIIIIEDADEMVRKSVLEHIEETIVDGSNAVGQEFRTCYMNWKCTNMPWWGSKILRRKFVTNPSEHRFHTVATKYIWNGGWHFNFWGGEEAIRRKIVSYAHQEFNIPDVLDRVGERLESMNDVLGRQYKYELVPIDDTLPKYLVDNLDKFEKYIYRGA